MSIFVREILQYTNILNIVTSSYPRRGQVDESMGKKKN